MSSAVRARWPDDKFYLVIKGRDAAHPARKLRGKRDIGIRPAIEALEAEPGGPRQPVLEPRQLVPGLITCTRTFIHARDRIPATS